jgi:hypothetical protein
VSLTGAVIRILTYYHHLYFFERGVPKCIKNVRSRGIYGCPSRTPFCHKAHKFGEVALFFLRTEKIRPGLIRLAKLNLLHTHPFTAKLLLQLLM